MKSIKFQIIAIFLFSILLNLSCSEKSPTTPEGETGNTDFTLQSTSNIGPGGGTISSDEFSLNVPAGSFSQQTELKLYSKEDTTLFGEETVTKLFRIEGLPSDYTTPVRVALKYNRTLQNESSIAVSEDYTDEFTGETGTVYDLVDAVDSSGFLVGYLKPSTNALTNTGLPKFNKNYSINDEGSKNIQGKDNGIPYESSNYIINFPATFGFGIDKFAENLEKNLTIIRDDLKLVFSKDDNSKWEVKITAGSFPSIKFEKPTTFYINREYYDKTAQSIVETEMGKSLLYHTLLGDHYKSKYIIPNDYWLIKALHIWSAELFSTLQDFNIPDIFYDNTLAPFNGISTGAGDNKYQQSYRHGLGMAALFKYLFDDNLLEKQQIGKIFESIDKNIEGKEPATLLIQEINGLKSDWWPDFFKHYVTGKIYNVSSEKFIENPDGDWNIEDDNDVSIVFGPDDSEVGAYPDLSAKRFLVNLNHQNIDEAKNLNISIEGEAGSDGLHVLVFGYNSAKLEFITEGSGSDVPPVALRSFYDIGIQKFLIVAINSTGIPPYKSESNVYLTLTAKEELDYTICNPQIKIDRVEGTTTKQDGSSSENAKAPFYILEPPYSYIGSFAGNTFEGTGTFTAGNTTHTGTILVELNDSYDMISYMKITKETTSIINGYNNNITRELEAENIPLSQQGKYEAFNEDVCNKIIKVNYHETYDHPSDGFESNFSNPSCDNSAIDDYIRIEFSK